MIWNVNATGAGGGVAESLRALLGYLLDAGIQARSLVLDGNDEFFAATKCLHNAIHGFGDDGQLGPAGHAEYQRTIAAYAVDLLARVRPDLVLLHDRQSAGLVPPLTQAGVRVAWRSRVGRDRANDLSRSAWEFLRPYVQDADALVFSRPQYAPDWVPPGRLQVIPPSIDLLAAKNQPLSAAQCRRILLDAGLLTADSDNPRAAVCAGAPPGPDARVIVQVSRWDRLKDMPYSLSRGRTGISCPQALVAGSARQPAHAGPGAKCADRQRCPAGRRDRHAKEPR